MTTSPAGSAGPTAGYRRARSVVAYNEGDHFAVVHPDGHRLNVAVFGRDEFLAERWDYRGGEHGLIVAPNGGGKTYLAYQLLAHTCSPDLPGYVLVAKPYDETSTRWARAMDWPIIRDYPPPLWRRLDKPGGYLVWPRQSFDIEADNARLFDVFERLIVTEAKKNPRKHGPRVMYADEIGALEELTAKRGQQLVALKSRTKAVLTRGRSGGFGAIGGTQMPVAIDTAWYSETKHLFLGYTSDARGRQRYDEIGGFESGAVKAVTAALPEYYFAYLRRRGRVFCIIGP